MIDIKIRVLFADGLEKIQTVSCPVDPNGAHYLPMTMVTSRPGSTENVMVSIKPPKTSDKMPLYKEIV